MENAHRKKEQHHNYTTGGDVETRNRTHPDSFRSGGQKERWQCLSSKFPPPHHCGTTATHKGQWMRSRPVQRGDSKFGDFRSSRDAEMKRIQGLGVGTRVRRAEIITVDEDEILWKKGLLGDKTPQSLLDTIIFLCGLFLHSAAPRSIAN